MKHSFIAAVAALSFVFSTSAMAKDIDAVDLFVGDFAGIASFDFDKLASNKMIDGAISQNIGASKDAEQILKDLQAAGIDYKKDIDTVTAAVTEKGNACAAIDTKKSVKDAFAKFITADMKTADHNGTTLYVDGENTVALISDTRIISCENKLDIKAIIDNAKSEKPKLLKDRDSKLSKAYALTDSKADVRIAGKMTPYLKSKSTSYKLDDGQGKSIAVADADSGAISISFAKGLNISIIATANSEEKSKDGAAIISTQLNAILSDPSLNELGLGFVKDAVKISNSKKNINATISLTDDQLSTIAALAAELTGATAPKAAAPKKAAAAK